MRRQIEVFKILIITGATLILGACETMPSISMPQPPSMPSSSPPASSPPPSGSSGSPSSSSPPPSGSPSQSSGSPDSGAQSPASGSPSSQDGSQSAGSSSPASQSEGQPSAGGGTPTDLDILEPEPVTNTADASDSMEESAESGGGEAGGGEEGGGEEGGGEEGGGEEGGGEEGGGEAGGGEAGGGAQAQGGGMQGGGSQGGSLDDELMASVEGFEDGMQQQILIIASASPTDGSDDRSQDIQGGNGEEGEGGGEFIDQTGGGAPGLIMIEGDVSQLPQGSGEVGGPTTSSGVVNVNDQGDIENRQTRQGDSQVARILVANIPPDIGDGSDDDVVARQIREAAENEQDPALREKLWQEYRNYKKSLGRKKF